MKTPTKQTAHRLAAALAIATALGAATTANAAGFWKGTGQDSGTAANWSNTRVFMNGDNFYFRDAKMTGTAYNRVMRLNANVNNTAGKMIFFQCGTEEDPFVVEDDGNNRTITLKYSNPDNTGNIYVGHSQNSDNTNNNTTDDAGYYGSAVLNGGTWTCNQLYVGDVVNGTNYWGYLRLNGASLTATGTGSSGNPCANGKIVVDAGTLSFTGGDLVVGKGGGTAELVINGGTVTVASGKWTKCTGGSSGTINLNGGTLMTKTIAGDGAGNSMTVNFNGGTLKANNEYNNGLFFPNRATLTVNVNAGGGTIDSGNYAITIPVAIGGGGGLIFTGGNTIMLTGAVSYSGQTAVTPGTILATSSATTKKNILDKGLVVADIPNEGDEIFIVTKEGETISAEQLAKVTCPLAPDTTFALGEGSTNIVVATVGDALDNYWTGEVDNDLSNDANWSSGTKPTGNANIFCASPATLTNGDGFAPTSITFLEGSAAVTIDGGDFTGITAVTNLSSVSHTINTKVYFTGDIQVKQAAMADTDDLTKAHVTFAGGAYAASGYALENSNSDAVYSRCMFGKYYFASTAESPWTATIYGNKKRICVAPDSYLYIPYAGNLKELDIRDRAKVDVGSLSFSGGGRFSHYNLGEMVVTNATMTGTGDRYCTYGQGISNPSVFKFRSLTNKMTNNWILFGDENVATTNTTYVGAGGINFDGSNVNSCYCLGAANKSGSRSILRAWDSDFTIQNIGGGTAGLAFDHDAEICTDDENNIGRTITLNVKTFARNSPTLTVSGSGTLQVNNDLHGGTKVSNMPVTVTDTATLAFGENGTLGTGTVTLDYGTTFSFFNTANDLSVKPAIALSGSGEGKATIKVDGKRLKSGTNLELITSGAPEGCAERVTVTGEALGGRKYTLTEDSGKLLLNVQSDGLMVIFR